jgi:hypothetical protein
MRTRSSLAILFSLAIGAALTLRADDEAAAPAASAAEGSAKADEAPPATDATAKATNKKVSRRLERADAFIAPADWEFDGFVAGGQDQEIRSLYYLNDLVYLNVGTDQGLSTGDRVSIFKRGERVRDPQTGKFLGYEVRRAATSQITDRIDGKNCSARILQANEAVEIGDLVRRDD